MHNHHVKLTITTYALLLLASPLIWASGVSAAPQNCPVGYVCTAVAANTPSINTINPNASMTPVSVIITGSNLNNAPEVHFYDSVGTLKGKVSVSSYTPKSVTFALTASMISTMGPGTYNVGVYSTKCKSSCLSNLLPFKIPAPGQAAVSLDAASPITATIPVNDTTNGQYLGLPVLVFDVNAQNDTLHLRSVTARIYRTGGGNGSVGTAYLYQGGALVSSASISNNTAAFSNIADGTAGATIPVNTTVPFIIKVDVTGLTSGSIGITAGVASSSASDLSVLSSSNSTALVSGGAQGNAQTVVSAGPQFTLVGTPTITKSNITPGNSLDTVFQYTATFNVNILAIGKDIIIGLPASTTSASFGNMNTGPLNAQVFQNGVASTTSGLMATYSRPTNTTFASNSFTVIRNQSVTVPVMYSFVVTNQGATSFAVQLQGIYWNGSNLANFMANMPTWRTPSI